MISAARTESDLDSLISGWLLSYFDGQTHEVNGTETLFPVVEIGFGQARLSQPLDGVGITVIHERIDERRFVGGRKLGSSDPVEGRSRVRIEYRRFLFIVRASARGTGQSRYQARQVGQLLRGLLSDPLSAYGLKGIRGLRLVDFAERETNKSGAECVLEAAGMIEITT